VQTLPRSTRQRSARVFERVSVKGVAESTRSLATHADFCKAVEEDSRCSAAEAAAAQVQAADAAAAAAAAAAGDAHGSNAAVRFHVDSSPAVISPLCSPLVARCGPLLRQSGGIMKTWKPVSAPDPRARRPHPMLLGPRVRRSSGVLTRDGFLHLFRRTRKTSRRTRTSSRPSQPRPYAAASLPRPHPAPRRAPLGRRERSPPSRPLP